jgi:lysophospholipase L1-like esterase
VDLIGATFFTPVKPEKKMFFYGDSISQGYDTQYPSNKYTAHTARALGVEGYNKAIGGEVFQPGLAAVKSDLMPDYISVAYGTNDWMFCEADVFREKCRAFYETLSRKYPTSSIIALTPIWRKDYANAHRCSDFSEIAAFIETVTAPLENVSCIHGFDLVPHDEDLYGDLELHPNDDGFAFYANGILDAVKEILEKRL